MWMCKVESGTGSEVSLVVVVVSCVEPLLMRASGVAVSR